jgi:SpoIID/LytB domain protein
MKFVIISLLCAALCCAAQEHAAALVVDQCGGGNCSETASKYNNALFFKAIREYKRIADNGNIEGYLNLAVIFKDLGYYEKAIFLLQKALRKYNEDLRALSFLGRMYYLNNQIDESISVLHKIMEIKPDDVDANITLGLCYKEKKEDAQAQKYFQKVISLDKNDMVARLSLADLYYSRQRLPEAIVEYKAAGVIDASIISIQKILGEIFLKMGNLQEALKIYQKIRLIEPASKVAEERVKDISLKIGAAYFQKEKEKMQLQRAGRVILVKPFSAVKNISLVRVGLIIGQDSAEFICSTPFEVKTKSGQMSVLAGSKNLKYRISRNMEGGIVISSQEGGNVIVDETVIAVPLSKEGTVTLCNVKLNKESFWPSQQDRSYRGAMEICADEKGIRVINILNLEEYLYSVVPSEMPARWPKEALKAQAVAARTESIANLGRHKKEGFDFCPEVHCCSYTGVERETEWSNQVVDETRGLAMLSEGKPVDALYSSNCGGHTQGNIFGDEETIPYLKSRVETNDENDELGFPLSPLQLEYWIKKPDKGLLCDLSEYSKDSGFRWVRIYTAGELNDMLGSLADFGRVIKIIVLKRRESGHVSAIKIIGTRASYVVEKELAIRKALGNLRSSMFKVEIKYAADKFPEAFIFYGGGWGHGVGLCQTGAYGLASQGKNFKEILNHYFQKIDFKKMY